MSVPTALGARQRRSADSSRRSAFHGPGPDAGRAADKAAPGLIRRSARYWSRTARSSAAAGPSRAAGRMPRSKRCAAPAPRRRARRSTSHSSPARISANRRRAPTRSSPPASRAWSRRSRIQIPEVAGAGHARLRAAGIAVDVGIGAEAARRDHAGHILRMREGRPHVLLKLAVSADGKAGAAGRQPVAITGEAVRDRVHLLRARSDAIMIGIGTALADDPMLTCRLPGMAAYSPVRVVLDTALRLPLGFAPGRGRRGRRRSGWSAVSRRRQSRSRRCVRKASRSCACRRSAGGCDLAAVLGLLAAARHHPADGRRRPDARRALCRRRSGRSRRCCFIRPRSSAPMVSRRSTAPLGGADAASKAGQE